MYKYYLAPIEMNTAKSKPICIQTKKFEDNTDIQIGTCRSYDEKRPIPSFIRQLCVNTRQSEMDTNKPFPKKVATQFDLN